MSSLTIEERLSALEKKVNKLLTHSEPQKKADWISHVVGSFADCPEFDEVIRLGREFRKEQNTVEDVSPEEYGDAK